MPDPDRTRLRELQAAFERRGDAVGWFEALYQEGLANPDLIPWARMAPRPELESWYQRTRPALQDRTCLVIGCGLGDDAEFLARAGGRVTAFDIAPTAVAWCRRRFPTSSVSYEVADLLHPPPDWRSRFDFILECNTLQTMRDEARAQAVAAIASLIGPGGRLLVICRGREPDEILGEVPWPLTRAELAAFARFGLVEQSFDDVLSEDVRRFVVEYRIGDGR
jgi:SAM-dependent methyltransferase